MNECTSNLSVLGFGSSTCYDRVTEVYKRPEGHKAHSDRMLETDSMSCRCAFLQYRALSEMGVCTGFRTFQENRVAQETACNLYAYVQGRI